jgi:hypothetical protein
MASTVYATKLKKFFDRIGTTAAAYAAKHPIGKRIGYGKMKDEIGKILPEYSSFAASAITDTQITLTWSGVSGASSHLLQKCNSIHFRPSASVSSVYTGSSLTADATSLTPATKYFFKVSSSATNKVGSSKIISATTLANIAAPATFVASAVTSTSMTLTWAAVPTATGYIVERATNAGFTAGLTTQYTGALLTTNVTGLTTATTYYFRVRATLAGSYGTYRTVSQLTS